MAIDRPLEDASISEQENPLHSQYVQEMGPKRETSYKTSTSTAADNGYLKMAALEVEKPIERSSLANQDQSKKILDVLNGTDGNGRTNIPPSTNQLVVVTSDDFKSPVAKLRVFERGSGHNADWHEVEDMAWPVNLGERTVTRESGEKVRSSGMAYGLGGLIENQVSGESTAGPPIKDGKIIDPRKDPDSHTKIEGDGRAPAGLFRLGFAWGFSKNPVETGMPYKDLNPAYRVVPGSGEELKNNAGERLNGQILRQVDAKTGAYESIDPITGQFKTGQMSRETLQNVLKLEEYRWVHKEISDNSPEKKSLKNQLVRIHPEDLQSDANDLPIFKNDARYESIDPRTGERHTGKLSEGAMKGIVRESDFRWSDESKYFGTENGKSVSLYNKPLRILNPDGEYERLDRDTGNVVARGTLDPKTHSEIVNESEEMSHELYRHALFLVQNEQGIAGGGSTIFIHEERKNIEAGAPSSTLGCTAMSQARMKQLLARLQYHKHPLILQAPIGELNNIRNALRHPG